MSARVGIVGVPPRDIIKELNQQGAEIIDLDEPQVKKSLSLVNNYLPSVYCAVLRTVTLNSTHLELDKIYMDVGPGKCDCALHLATVLANTIDTEIIKTRNLDRERTGNPLCTSRMNMVDKMVAITNSIKVAEPKDKKELPPCKATAGFWGVPPKDFQLLELFPDTTHIYGWTRCMENKTPADLELESIYNHEIPTVFFSQSFCAKSGLAFNLAKRHPRGLFVDCDVAAGASIKAKIEAFFELNKIKL